ncbi:MAG: inorganic phosphate transporter [Nostocaceae cyanobacterium]|nr:inorganic phosphate transporter [Nostocaceae cyanobacterium]
MIITITLLAFYVAWNLGANDVANAMGTSVGSKAITLKQALIIAGVLEFTGALLFGQEVSQTLATKIIDPSVFTDTPQLFVTGMIAVLLAGGVWLQIATAWGLPVSSSHAIVGAIAGFSCIVLGVGAIDWKSIGMISLGWIVTPVLSGTIAALIYSKINYWILKRSNQLEQLQEWIPWLSVSLMGIFGIIVLPTLTQPVTTFLVEKLGINIPAYDIPIFTGAMAAVGLSAYSWRHLEGMRETVGVGFPRPLGFPHPLEFPRVEEGEEGEEREEGEKFPITNYLLPITHSPIESLFARYQLLSACFVAFAHGSNDVGNAIAPLAAIAYVYRTGSVPQDGMTIPVWILMVGGIGIVSGLAVWGKKVIATIGENIIPLQPSSGFCAEIATATTILLASRLGLPVSTSHALVGAVAGIGLIQNAQSLKFQTLQNIAAAWLVTVPVSAALSAVIFCIIRMF